MAEDTVKNHMQIIPGQRLTIFHVALDHILTVVDDMLSRSGDPPDLFRVDIFELAERQIQETERDEKTVSRKRQNLRSDSVGFRSDSFRPLCGTVFHLRPVLFVDNFCIRHISHHFPHLLKPEL